jgi:hypothetical protein
MAELKKSSIRRLLGTIFAKDVTKTERSQRKCRRRTAMVATELVILGRSRRPLRPRLMAAVRSHSRPTIALAV